MAVWTQHTSPPDVMTAEILNEYEQNGEYLAAQIGVTLIATYKYTAKKSTTLLQLITYLKRQENQCYRLSSNGSGAPYDVEYERTEWNADTSPITAIQKWIDFQNACYATLANS